MQYLTTRKKPKPTTKTGLVASYDIQPGNGVGQFWDTTHTPDPHGGKLKYKACDNLTLFIRLVALKDA